MAIESQNFTFTTFHKQYLEVNTCLTVHVGKPCLEDNTCLKVYHRQYLEPDCTCR